MHNNNSRFLRTIALICTAILSFNSLLPVYRSGKRLATTRQSSSTIAPKPIISPVSVTPEQEEIKPSATEKKLKKKNDTQALPETEENKEEAMKMEAKLPAPTGFFSKAYTLVTPLIIASLDTALGVAIATGTKTAIKNAMARHAFKNMLSDAQNRAPAAAKAYDQILNRQLEDITQSEEYSENPKKYDRTISQIQKYLSQPIEYKKNQEIRKLLKEQKIKDPEAMEKATSGQSIFAAVIYTTAITALINTLGTFIGYATKLSLRGILERE